MSTLEDQMLEERKKSQLDRKLILESLFRKWNPIALGCKVNEGPSDCPLCDEYFGVRCNGCPVKLSVGYSGCDGTPYEMCAEAGEDDELWDAMEAEIDFLISLLTPEDQENIEGLHKEWTEEQKNAVQ